jgi:hypothetical protein
MASVNFTVGPVSASVSTVAASLSSVPDDGQTISTITVTLLDANSNPVSGKTVTLAKSGGTSVITTVSGTSNSSGQATFTVTDHSTVESVTYTATDTTDSRVITQTAVVSFVAATMSVSPPGLVSLSLLNAPATAMQIVGAGTAGSVTAAGIGLGSYTVTVSANPIYLTNGSYTLANALSIATGSGTAQIGTLAAAASVVSGAYSGTDAAKFVPVTVTAQPISNSLTAASFPISLYAYQEINANEAHPIGSYALTLTYTATANF